MRVITGINHSSILDNAKRVDMEKKNTGKKQRLSEYVMGQLPAGAVVEFVFCGDLDNDGQQEAVVGITRFLPFPPDSAVMVIKKRQSGIDHGWVSFPDTAVRPCGVFDNAAMADIDGDGMPELVVSRVLSHEHDIDILVFDWNGNGLQPAWHSGEKFFHGSMEVDDIDGDGISEIIVEYGTHSGDEVIATKEACYHVREGYAYKWDGHDYVAVTHQVRAPYISYNMAVGFLRAIWLRDYAGACRMAAMPCFLGLTGLDDCSVKAFKSHVDKKVLPALVRNISRSKLIPSEPYDTCCQFTGPEDRFTVEFVRMQKKMMVSSLTVTKKIT